MARRKKANKMTSPTIQLGWIPEFFDISNRFVYFNSLAYKPPKGPVLLDEASNIQAPSNDTNEGKTKLEYAIQFLSNIAYNEQQKEKEAIEYYKNKICNQFSPESKIRKELEKIFNIKGVENTKDIELQLIEQINIIKQGFTQYKNTIKEIIDNQDKTLNDLRKNSFRFSHQQFIEENLFAIPENQEVENNLFELIEQYIKNFQPNLKGADIYALMAAIALDFQNYINSNALTVTNDFSYLFEDYIKNGETLIEQLLEQTKKDEVTGERIISGEQGNKELMSIITHIKSEFGIDLKPEQEMAQITQNYNAIIQNNKLTKEQKKQAIKELKAKVQQIKAYKNTIMRKIGDELLIFSLHTNQSHGDINEIFKRIIQRAIDIGGSGATDTISHLGQIGIKLNKDFLTKTYEPFEEMSKIITNYTNYSNNIQERDIGTASFKNAENEYIKMNNKINEKIDNLETQLNKLGIDKMFVTHESLKLYASFETGKANKLHGRAINALTGLEQIFSLSGAGLTGEDQDVIIHILINLATCCSNQQEPLEKYLSIFAGLLMFDDAYNMAEEISKSLPKENTIEQIHLYDVNGIYIPSSIVLQNIVNSFSNNLINIEEGAKITIKPYSPKDDPQPDSEQDWENIANQTIKGTSLNITFLMGLMDIIKKLS